MDNNEVLVSLSHSQKLDEATLIEILSLVNVKVAPAEISSWLKVNSEEGYKEFTDKMMAYFLNAFVLYKRGKDDSNIERPLETPITNNIILKKLRVAFKLQETDMIELLKKAKFSSSPKEWSAYFRKSAHKNYKECPDNFLESVLKGLAS